MVDGYEAKFLKRGVVARTTTCAYDFSGEQKIAVAVFIINAASIIYAPC